MANLLYFIPIAVVLMEYTAFSSALTYSRFVVEYQQPVVSLFGGLLDIGSDLPYDAIPNTVATLHVLSLLLSVVFLVYFMFVGWNKTDENSL